MTAVVALVAAVLVAGVSLAFTLAPLAGAHQANRPMTPAERDALTWGGLGIFLALFTVAAVLIGARP